MATTRDIADAVVDALNDEDDWGEGNDFIAERTYLPGAVLEEACPKLRVLVAIAGRQKSRIAREVLQSEHTVQVAVTQRTNDPSRMDELSELTEAMEELFLGARNLPGVAAVVTGIETQPYDQRMLWEYSLWLSVLTLTIVETV